MQSERGRKIHGEASDAREAGEFLKALQLIDEAVIIYIEDKDVIGLSEVMGMKALTFRHLARKTKDLNYLVLAKYSVMAAIEIAKKSGELTAIVLPTFDLAKVMDDLGDFGEAAQTYEDAVTEFEKNPPQSHNRAGVIADMKVHLYTAKYKAGDKMAFPKVLGALEELENSDEKLISKYNYDVWTSGAHMRIAEMLKDDDKELSKKHLDEAKKIIDANNELKLRRQQWEELASLIN